MSHVNQTTREITCTVLYGGPAGSGKTTSLRYLGGRARRERAMRVTRSSADILSLDLGTVSGFAVRFQVYAITVDTTAETRQLMLNGADGIVFVADSQAVRFDENRVALSGLQRDLAADLPIVMQYNKQDLPRELILAPGERLPESWAVAGTTGYEFLNLLNGVFVDRAQALALDRLYRRVAQDGSLSFGEIAYQAKRFVMETAMASEIAVLAHRLNVISEKHRSTRDFTTGTLRRALREIIASFPVYRTYAGDAAAGAMQFTRMLWRAHSRAPVRVIAWIASFAAL